MKLREIDDLEPGPHQVRIDIEACGVNFPDTLIIEDKYQFKPPLPFSPGGEVSGIVSKLGSEVSGVEVGDKVMAMTLSGGFSEQILVDASALLYRPEKNGWCNCIWFYNDLWNFNARPKAESKSQSR